jgi:hypothetical protein
MKKPVRPWPHRLLKPSDCVDLIGWTDSAGFSGLIGLVGRAVAVVAIFDSDFGFDSYSDFFGSLLTPYPIVTVRAKANTQKGARGGPGPAPQPISAPSAAGNLWKADRSLRE